MWRGLEGLFVMFRGRFLQQSGAAGSQVHALPSEQLPSAQSAEQRAPAATQLGRHATHSHLCGSAQQHDR